MKSWNNVSTHIALFGWNSVDITSILPRVLKTLSGELSYYSVIQIKQCGAICDRGPLSVLWYLFLNAQNLHIENRTLPCEYLIWLLSLHVHTYNEIHFQTTLTQHDAGLYEVQYALKYYKSLLFTCNNVVLLYNSNFSLFVSCWHELYLLFHSWEKNINPARSDPRRTLTMLICFL